MLRAGAGLALACGLLFCGMAQAQDSGPGPIVGTGSAQYEVTVLKIGSSTTGTFDFALATEEPGGEEPTGSVVTTGTFTSTLGTTTGTGTWFAIDVGNYALWYATAEGTAGTQTITGLATPEFIVGRIVTTSSASNGSGRFVRALFNTSIFFGTAVDVETPTEEPMEE